jgi:cephalosporin hydroxylase
MPAARVPSSLAEAAHRLGDPRASPDGPWVAKLTGLPLATVWEAMRGVEAHLDVLDEVRRRHIAQGRAMYAQIRAPFELYTLVRLLRPNAVVETGVSSGVSSLHFLLGLEDNRAGRLFSVDLPTRQKSETLGKDESPVSLPPGEQTGWVVPAEYRKRWTLTLGASQEKLPRVVQGKRSIGIFLHDSLHTAHHLAFELETVRPHLAAGAIVLADNTSWTGKAFDRFAESVGAPIRRRGRTDLVGLRMPIEPRRASGRARTRRSPATR